MTIGDAKPQHGRCFITQKVLQTKRGIMNAEQRAVTLECLRRQRAIEQFEPPENEWRWWVLDEIKTEREHGPRYACGDWFTYETQRQRMRYRRAIETLERGGILKCWKQHGRKLSHLQLTPAGMKHAERLEKGTECKSTSRTV